MKIKNKILVIATGAKHGGAATILNCALNAMEKSSDTEYFVFGGIRVNMQTPSIKYYYVPTNGLGTFLFTIVIAPILALVFRCSKVVSFSNIAPYPLWFKSVAYFHQFLLLTDNNAIRRSVSVMYSLCISSMMKNAEIIVQSRIVRELFLNKFGNDFSVMVRWPGIFYAKGLTEGFLTRTNEQMVILFPVSSTSPNKNIELFKKIYKKNPTMQFHSLLPCNYTEENHTAIGQVSFDRVAELILQADAMIFTSMEETLGLPIFEFALTGKPVYVFKRPYTDWILEKFPFLTNISFFKDENVYISRETRKEFTDQQINQIVSGEWDFL